MDYIHVYIHTCVYVRTLIVPKFEKNVFRLLCVYVVCDYVCMWCICVVCAYGVWCLCMWCVCVFMRVRSHCIPKSNISFHVVSMGLNKSKKKHELRRNMLNKVMHE